MNFVRAGRPQILDSQSLYLHTYLCTHEYLWLHEYVYVNVDMQRLYGGEFTHAGRQRILNAVYV